MTLTIKEVKQENLQVPGSREKNQKPVVYWVESQKPMVLNVTNSRKIDEIANSRYVEDWKGVKVAVYIDDKIRFGSEMVEGLRIKKAIKKTVTNTAKAKAAIRSLLSSMSKDKAAKIKPVIQTRWDADASFRRSATEAYEAQSLNEAWLDKNLTA
ncbi:MAG: hypothetical protein AAFP08_01930 [Bacteroidota bacterium]